MLRTTLGRQSIVRAATRASYATSAPATSPPPYPAVKSGLYDPDQEPALADLGYPKLSRDSRQLRSPRGWWDTQERINFGEPVSQSLTHYSSRG
jgi:NADH dehydrogenase (ubiquinone) 1 beta subcomplex subunit 8